MADKGPAQPATLGAVMATFAETMLSKYETLLETSAGLDTISVDGQSVRYTGVEAKYRYWKREVGREKGTRPRAAAGARNPWTSAARGGKVGGEDSISDPPLGLAGRFRIWDFGLNGHGAGNERRRKMRSVKAIGGSLLAGCLGLAVLWVGVAGCGPTQEKAAPVGGAAAAGAGAALADPGYGDGSPLRFDKPPSPRLRSPRPPVAPGAAAAAEAPAAAPAPDAEPPTQTKFSPTWDSLKRYEVPAWFRDAKFGIWAHWSAQCVPEEGDWYARGMYEEGGGH